MGSRNLTRAQKDKLRELDRESLRISQEAVTKKAGIQSEAEKLRAQHQRKAADAVKAHHDRFAKERKKIEHRFAVEQKGLRKALDGEIGLLNKERKVSYEEEELVLMEDLAAVEAWESETLAEVDVEVDRKLRELQMAREIILGSLKEEADNESVS